MSNKYNDTRIENLIETYDELRSNWNGKDEKGEQAILEIEGELIELGIEIDDVNNYLDTIK